LPSPGFFSLGTLVFFSAIMSERPPCVSVVS
jgi:hypothetical protein